MACLIASNSEFSPNIGFIFHLASKGQISSITEELYTESLPMGIAMKTSINNWNPRQTWGGAENKSPQNFSMSTFQLSKFPQEILCYTSASNS